MTDALLLVGGTRSPEVRHEIAADIPDAAIWLGRADTATVWASRLDLEPIQAAGAIDDVRSTDELGAFALRAERPMAEVLAEMTRRAVAAEGLRRVRVPWDFPMRVADVLRAEGVEVAADPDAFALRRRAKREWELEGMRLAAGAAQAALLEAATLLRDQLAGLTASTSASA